MSAALPASEIMIPPRSRGRKEKSEKSNAGSEQYFPAGCV
jgi:hypothetical protein